MVDYQRGILADRGEGRMNVPFYILNHHSDIIRDLCEEGADKFPYVIRNYEELGCWWVDYEQKGYLEVRRIFTEGKGYSFQAYSRGVMSGVWGPISGTEGHTEQQVFEAIGRKLLEEEINDLNAVDIETLDRYILNLTQARDKLTG